MANRIIFTLIIGLIPFLSKSEIKEVNTCGDAMTISVIRIIPQQDYQKLLMVGHPIGKTIELNDLDSLSAFVDSILKQTKFISVNSILNPSNLYMKYWTFNKPVYAAGEKFMFEFDERINDFGQKIDLLLNDKTKIEISYLDVYGFFIYGDKNALYPLGENSLSINYKENKYVDNVWFLMSVVCYNKTESTSFVIKNN